MRVEEVAAGQPHPQDRLDDVAHRAVVGQTDLLRRVHEVTATEGRSHRRKSPGQYTHRTLVLKGS